MHPSNLHRFLIFLAWSLLGIGIALLLTAINYFIAAGIYFLLAALSTRFFAWWLAKRRKNRSIICCTSCLVKNKVAVQTETFVCKGCGKQLFGPAFWVNRQIKSLTTDADLPPCKGEISCK